MDTALLYQPTHADVKGIDTTSVDASNSVWNWYLCQLQYQYAGCLSNCLVVYKPMILTGMGGSISSINAGNLQVAGRPG